jgi:hypothetical protein
MTAFDRLAEERIQEATERGLFRALPGKGRPLDLEDLSAVPDDLRVSYVLLRSAGVLPEEMELRKGILRLGDLLAACQDEGRARELTERRNALVLRHEILCERRWSARRFR